MGHENGGPIFIHTGTNNVDKEGTIAIAEDEYKNILKETNQAHNKRSWKV